MSDNATSPEDKDKEDIRRRYQRFRSTLVESRRPLVFWLGAGVSAWADYPLWHELAERTGLKMQHCQGFDHAAFAALTESGDLPAAFQTCRDASASRFYDIISRYLRARRINNPLFFRFANSISRIVPTSIISINIDESIERALPHVPVFQFTDAELAARNLQERKPFILKLHGSVSSIQSSILTRDDYNAQSASKLLETVSVILSGAHLVCLGTSMRDKYVVDILANNHNSRALLGDGPHFMFSSSDMTPALPASFVRLPYSDSSNHMAVIDHLDDIATYRPRGFYTEPNVHAAVVSKPAVSAHFLCTPLFPGTWTTSQHLRLDSVQPDGAARQTEGKPLVIVGTGFTNDELITHHATGLHDIAVGLICFDTLYAPLSSCGVLHNALTPGTFWELVTSGSLRFVDWEDTEIVAFGNGDMLAAGGIATMKTCRADLSFQSTSDRIRRQIGPVPGRETEAEKQFEALERMTITITTDASTEILPQARQLLVRPKVLDLLGFSQYTPTGAVPQWLAHPVLRLMSAIKIAHVCRLVGIPSLRLDYASSALMGPVFSASEGDMCADDAAAYVASGEAFADIGSLAERNPEYIRAIIAFRSTPEALALRREVMDKVASNPATALSAALDCALVATVSRDVLLNARRSLSQLLAPSSASGLRPLILRQRGATSIALWKKRSLGILKSLCQKHRIDVYATCPCGSGAKLRHCCLMALMK